VLSGPVLWTGVAVSVLSVPPSWPAVLPFGSS
jgi:hypothetical protein